MASFAKFPNDNILGVLNRFMSDQVHFLKTLEQTGEDIIEFRLAHQKLLYVRGPEALNQMHRDWRVAGKPSLKRMHSILGKGVIFENGDAWVQQRKALAPAFHRSAISSYVKIIHGLAMEHVEAMDAYAEQGQPYPIGDATLEVANRVVRDTLFGTKNDPLELQVVLDAIEVLLDYSIKTSTNPLLPPLWVPTAENKKVKRHLKAVQTIIRKIIAEKRAAPEFDTSAISLMLNAFDGEGNRIMDDDKIVDQVKIFFVAGTETSSNTITFLLKLLSDHPEWYSQVKSEIENVLGDRPITMEDLRSMPILYQVIHETLRLYPATWLNTRELYDDMVLDGIPLRKGSRLMFSTYWHHRNPELWENPEQFDPTRFKLGTPPPSYFHPFVVGPRRCIGDQLALTEISVVVATWLQHFDLKWVAGQDDTIKFGSTLSFQKPIKMHVEPAKQLIWNKETPNHLH